MPTCWCLDAAPGEKVAEARESATMRRCCSPRLDSGCSARAKYLKYFSAGVAELVDAPDSKSGSGNRVWVRFPPPAPRSTIALVLHQSVVELEPRLRPRREQVAVGLEPRGVIERAGLDGDVLGVDVELRQERRAAEGAEIPVDRLAGIAGTRVSLSGPAICNAAASIFMSVTNGEPLSRWQSRQWQKYFGFECRKPPAGSDCCAKRPRGGVPVRRRS